MLHSFLFPQSISPILGTLFKLFQKCLWSHSGDQNQILALNLPSLHIFICRMGVKRASLSFSLLGRRKRSACFGSLAMAQRRGDNSESRLPCSWFSFFFSHVWLRASEAHLTIRGTQELSALLPRLPTQAACFQRTRT